MKGRIFLAAGMLFLSTCNVWAIEKTTPAIDNLVKVFEQNPSDAQTTVKLLEEMRKQGLSGQQEVINRYFQTQQEADYYKNYNWEIIRDYVTDLKSPQLQYVFNNCDKFVECFSRDDVFQKLDNVLVSTLEPLYKGNKKARRNARAMLTVRKDAQSDHCAGTLKRPCGHSKILCGHGF